MSAEGITLMRPGKPAWATEGALAAAKVRGQRLGGFRGYVPSETNRAQAARARAAVARERAAQVLPVIREVRPQVLVTYDENGGYGHPDHIQTHRVAMAALDAAANPAWDTQPLF